MSDKYAYLSVVVRRDGSYIKLRSHSLGGSAITQSLTGIRISRPAGTIRTPRSTAAGIAVTE